MIVVIEEDLESRFPIPVKTADDKLVYDFPAFDENWEKHKTEAVEKGKLVNQSRNQQTS